MRDVQQAVKPKKLKAISFKRNFEHQNENR